MAQDGRLLAMAFARLCGLDPTRVRRLTLTADARDGVLVAEVVMFPELTMAELVAFSEAVDDNPQAMRLHVTEDGGDLDGS